MSVGKNLPVVSVHKGYLLANVLGLTAIAQVSVKNDLNVSFVSMLDAKFHEDFAANQRL